MNFSIIEMSNVLDNSTLEDSERMLRSFYRTIEPYKKRDWKNPTRISWEIFAEKDKIGFYVVVPSRLERLIKSRIKDAYPSAEVRTIEEDYTRKFVKPFTSHMDLHKHHMFSTKLNAGDIPLNSILNSMSRLEDDEKMLLQITMLPINNAWQGKAYAKYRDMLFKGIKPIKPRKRLIGGILYSLNGLFGIIEAIYGLSKKEENKNTPIEREELKGTQKKISLPAFNTSIRMAVESKNPNISNTRLTELANSMIELDSDNEWRRVEGSQKNTLKFIRERKVDKHTNNILTTQELSPVVRLANKSINVPELKKALKTLPIPQGLEQGLFFAHGMYNSEYLPVFMNENLVDDLVHPSIITGAMGAGKTTLIINMMLERATKGYSTILIDTQGDMSTDFLNQLPESEHHRVVWLNYGDLNNPPALDLLEFNKLTGSNNKVDSDFVKDIAKSELISIMKKMWGDNFGPQTEYITRNNITATIETGGTFMELFRMLVDDQFREEIIMQLRHKSPLTFSFFRTFQDNYSSGQRVRMLMPSINKIGSFVESPMIRNILCQGEQKYNFREMMDNGKIVVVTIPKGILVNAWKLIGSLIISKVWLASLSRANQPINERKPCFIASDEAEDIINDNFPIMLSQSRKFRLGIILGFQYLEQIKHENKKVYTAILGNKPNYFSLKIGERDLDVYAEIYKDFYTKNELRGFPNLHGVAQVSINGKPTNPFTIKIPYNYNTRDDSPRKDNTHMIEKIAEESRKLYAKPLHEVEELTSKRYHEIVESLSLTDEGHDYDIEVDESIIKDLKQLV